MSSRAAASTLSALHSRAFLLIPREVQGMQCVWLCVKYLDCPSKLTWIAHPISPCMLCMLCMRVWERVVPHPC